MIYTLNQGSNTVSVINSTTNKVVATIPVGSNPVRLAADHRLAYPNLYILNQGSNTVSVINRFSNDITSKSGFQIIIIN